MSISLSLRAVFGVASIIVFTVPSFTSAISAISLTSLNYQFSVDGTLKETGSMSESSSPYWWVSSGGYMILDGGRGMTQQGTAPSGDEWRVAYASSNALDTDGGTHPQNIFRMVSRSKWDNVRVDTSYRIKKDNFSSSPNRNQSNGLLQMLRYKDQYNLYYVGIRVDGNAIIKKKKNGVYTTLAEKKIFPGTYSVGGTDNFLPHDTWITLRGETITNSDGSVSIRLFMKKEGETAFTKLLETKDTANTIVGSGYMGIRTDFMDVEFDNIKATQM